VVERVFWPVGLVLLSENVRDIVGAVAKLICGKGVAIDGT